jgi:hypothetical protein
MALRAYAHPTRACAPRGESQSCESGRIFRKSRPQALGRKSARKSNLTPDYKSEIALHASARAVGSIKLLKNIIKIHNSKIGTTRWRAFPTR